MSKHHRHYKHLHIPETWEQYWSKYPNGYTMLESLIDWVSQVNKMISSFNNLSDEYTTLNRNMRALEKELRASWKGYKDHTEKTYEDFRDEILTIVNQWIATIEPTIQDEVVKSLSAWLDDGTLAEIINEDVFDMKANQTDLEETNAQLAQITSIVNPTMTTQEIQNQLDKSGDIKFVKGVYTLEFIEDYPRTTALSVRSNTRVTFEDGAVLTIPPTDEERYRILAIDDVQNVTINGGEIVGDKGSHLGTTGEWGFGIAVYGSSNVKINNTIIKDCWGDGVMISRSLTDGQQYSKNVYMNGVVMDNNRRQGCSVISCDGLWINDCEAKNTGGAAPEAGIDFEPDHPGQVLKNINLNNFKTSNNAGPGILVAPFQLARGSGSTETHTITITNHESRNDFRGIWFTGSDESVTKIKGKVIVDGAYIDSPQLGGVQFDNWFYPVLPPVDIMNVTVKNPNGANSTNLGNTGRSAFTIYARDTQRDGEYGGVNFINCHSTDDRADDEPRTLKAFWFEGQKKETQRINANVINCSADVYNGNGFVRWYKGKGIVKNDDQLMINISEPYGDSGDDATGQVITALDSQSRIALSPANDMIGREFKFVNTGHIIDISLKEGDKIIGYEYITGYVRLMKTGDVLSIKSIGNGQWVVTSINGLPISTIDSPQANIRWRSAAPQSDTPTERTLVFNANPKKGDYIGWVNISDEWVGFGKIETEG